ncbi:kinase-like domain-containing protein, partial [Glomus cerebriforme]
KKQLEALKYYEVVEWIPFDRFNNIEVIKGEFGSVIKANWIDGSIRSWDDKNNKWSRIFSNEAYCLRIISDISNISDISEIENQYKVRNTDARNLINYIAICGITKNPENHNYMVVMGYQDVCDQCLWPPTEKKWCNSCNSKRFQDEFKNWTSGNEIIDKYIQEKQLTALNRDDAIEWISFDTFKDVCLIEGEFGTALRANLIVNFEIDDDDVDEEWAELMGEWIETQSRLPNFREDRKNLIKVYGITKDPEKHDFMIVTEYNEKKICYKCLLPNTGEYWCNKCNSKYFQNEFEKWTSDNELIDEFIQKKQLEAINTKEFIEWIHFDKLQDVEQIGQGGFGTAFKATWIDGYIWRWNHENNEWKRTSEFEVCLKRLDKSHTVSREFLREVETQLNAQRYGNTIPIYGITKDPEHDDYMIVMDYAKVGSLRKMLNEQYSALIMTDIYNAWITDFGLCKPVTSDREKDIYGVLPYIAPEAWSSAATFRFNG